MATRSHPHLAAVRALRAFGLAYPEAHTKSPWPGHLDLAVRDKTFAFLSIDGEPLGISCKLPRSCSMALSLRSRSRLPSLIPSATFTPSMKKTGRVEGGESNPPPPPSPPCPPAPPVALDVVAEPPPVELEPDDRSSSD